MLILIGRSGSGKDTVAKELQRRGWNRIVTDTTRKMRKSETEGVEYNFISQEEFEERKKHNYYIDVKCFTLSDCSKVFYGVPELGEGLDKSFLVLPPSSFLQLGLKAFSVYIYANNATIKKRLLERGDPKDEVERRMKADSKDFWGLVNHVDKIAYNNMGENIENVVDKIEGWYNKYDSSGMVGER